MAGLEALDEAAPRDTDPVSLGDDAIRETRQKTKTSVGLEHYLDGPHKIPQGTTAQRPAAGRAGRLYFNKDTKYTECDDGTAWISASQAKARASLLWHSTQQTVVSGATRLPVYFDYIIDDPGGFAAPQSYLIQQPLNSMGMVSAYIELNTNPDGFGFILCIEQHDGTNWYALAQVWTPNQNFLGASTIVDSRWGLPLRVTVTSGCTKTMYINPTALGASPRFGYALLGRTS